MSKRTQHNTKGQKPATHATYHSYKDRNMNRNRRPPMLESARIDLRGRKVCTEDFENAALVCKYADKEIHDPRALMVAQSLAQAFEAAVQLSLNGEHREAAKKAHGCKYSLQRTPAVNKLRVTCRDGRVRRLADVVKWFAATHDRIASDIEAAQAWEAQFVELGVSEKTIAIAGVKAHRWARDNADPRDRERYAEFFNAKVSSELELVKMRKSAAELKAKVSAAIADAKALNAEIKAA